MKKIISALIALLIILCAHDVYSLVYKPNTAYTKLFTTSKFSTGELYNATGTPAATANKNGTDDGAFTLTTASAGTGRYKITGTVPAGYAAGDVVNVYVTATVDGVSAQAVVDTFTVDTSFASDNLSSLGTNAPADWINADAVKADAVTKIQAGLSTYTGGTVAGVTNPVTLTADYDAAKTAASQASVDAIPTALEIDTQLSSTHGANTWEDSGSSTTYSEGNVKKTFVLATVANATRKVGVGKIDYIKIETKADGAADWSAPTSTKYLYFWYTTSGDVNPYKVGENN